MFKAFKEAWEENKIRFIIDVSAAIVMFLSGYAMLYVAFLIGQLS